MEQFKLDTEVCELENNEFTQHINNNYRQIQLPNEIEQIELDKSNIIELYNEKVFSDIPDNIETPKNDFQTQIQQQINEEAIIQKEFINYQYIEIRDAICSLEENIIQYELNEIKKPKLEIDKIYLSKESELVQEEISSEFHENYELDREDIHPQFFLLISQMNIFEKMKHYEDSYPFLSFRKKIWYCQSLISYLCRKIITSWVFEFIALLVIIANSVVLALQDPTDNSTSVLSDTIDWVFLWLYTVEMILKIMGLGFFLGKKSYIRDPWNVLDFVIVFTAWLPKFQEGGGSGSLNSLRVLRVLRPLRTISSVKPLRVILVSLFSAIRLLLDIMIVLLFFFMVFAIGGLQLFMGFLKRRCFSQQTGIPIDSVFCSQSDQCAEYNDSNNIYICGKMISNPNYNLVNFDTFGWAFLQVFQTVTMEGWSDTMHMIQDSFSIFSFIYFYCIVFIGAFLLMNLTLAIITTKFDEAQKESLKQELQPQKFQIEQNARKQYDLKKFLELGIYISNKQKKNFLKPLPQDSP